MIEVIFIKDFATMETGSTSHYDGMLAASLIRRGLAIEIKNDNMKKVKVEKLDKRTGMRKVGTEFLVDERAAEIYIKAGLVSDPLNPVKKTAPKKKAVKKVKEEKSDK